MGFGGIKDLFEELYVKMENFIGQDPTMSKDQRMHLTEMHEVIMFQLH